MYQDRGNVYNILVVNTDIMHGFHSNIEHDTLANTYFRKVLYSGEHLQLVLMTLQPGEDIGVETHHENDQFFRFESGEGKCMIDDNEYDVTDGSAILIPAGAKHNIINTSTDSPLQMYTLYGPSHHKDAIVHTSKAEALANEQDFDGQTTE